MKRQKHKNGSYDIPRIMTKPFEPCPATWKNFVGDLKVESIPGKGRGVVAYRDIPACTLVCAHRAFEIVYLDDHKEAGVSEESLEALEQLNLKDLERTLGLLARKVYDKLKKFPLQRADIYTHHAGNQLGHLEPSPNQDIPDLDMTRIYGICCTNAFANCGDSYPEVDRSVGLWSFPAYVNHHCVGGNSTWKIFGDYFFIRTIRPVKTGEEIIFSYVSPSFPYEARVELLERRLGFRCTCELCLLDRSLPEAVQREIYKLRILVQNQEVKFSKVEPTQESVDASTLLLEQIIKKLESLQPSHGLLNSSLIHPLQKLGLKYFSTGAYQKTIKLMEKVCSILESCSLPHGVADCSLWIVASFLKSADIKSAKSWGKTILERPTIITCCATGISRNQFLYCAICFDS